LKKLGVTNIPAIEEVNLFTADGKVIHFSNPKVQASIAANTYVISGPNDSKQLTELLPGIMNQLGPDNISHLKQIADSMSSGANETKTNISTTHGDADDDDVPDLVANFEDVSKM
jgi:nascent polypeptide-associated complex subunit beta